MDLDQFLADAGIKIDSIFIDNVDDKTFEQRLLRAKAADAVVLRQAESKEQIIARADIEEIRASGKSLMPEGVEKEIDVQQMADLLEYLKTRDRKTIALTPTASLNPGEKTKP